MSTNTLRGGLALLAALVTAAHAGDPPAAAPREPLDLVPAESLLCWAGQPLPAANATTATQPSAWQTVLELGTRLAGSAAGNLDPATQLGLRGAELFSLMIRYPHAVALIDTDALPVSSDPTARRVDRLRCVAIARNGSDREVFLRTIQKTVNEHTDSGQATLETRPAGSWTYQLLTDRRLPPWAQIAWGQIDDHFVLTLGPDVWPLVARVAAGEAPALSGQEWCQAARQPRRDQTLIEIYVAAAELRARLDPLLDGRAGAFFNAWDAPHLQKAYWALGLQGPALFCQARLRIAGRTIDRLYADPDNRDAQLLAAVPEGAHYAIYTLPMDRTLSRLSAGIVSILGTEPRETVRRIWAEIEARPGFDIRHKLLSHVGEHVIFHNDPPHPLGLPVAVTTLIELRGGASEVRETLDTIATGFQEALRNAAAEGRGPPPWRLARETDGTWYVRLGPIAGPAWTVTDRFIVLSWSPWALHTYLDRVRLPASPASQPTAAATDTAPAALPDAPDRP